MKNTYIKIITLLGIFVITTNIYGQQKKQLVPNFTNPFKNKSSYFKSKIITPNNNDTIIKKQLIKPEIEINNGSFYTNLETHNINIENVSRDFNAWFNLNEQHSFQKVSERADELGFTHTNFQHYFKGFAIDGKMILLHSKNGIVTSISGNISKLTDIESQITITAEQAKNIAKSYLKVTKLINDYPVETVITSISTENNVKNTKLALIKLGLTLGALSKCVTFILMCKQEML
jgi:Zn-dependent metalloprotease